MDISELNDQNDYSSFLHYSNRTSPNSVQILSKGDVQALSAYLNDPVSSGLWRLDAEWRNENCISSLIWEQISNKINSQDDIVIVNGKRKSRFKLDEEFKEDIKVLVFNRITFIFTLFKFIVEISSEENNHNIYWIADSKIQLVLDLIDINSIKSKYPEAIEFFAQEIWFQDFDPIVRAEHICRLKCGLVITLAEPRNSHDISIISWSSEPLKKLSKFLELLNKTEQTILMPIFSPEEEVFAPYFDLLEITYPYIVKQSHLRPFFRKSINHFKEKILVIV